MEQQLKKGKAMKFFAFFRRLFALDKSYEVLAEVLYDAVKTIYIPALQKLARHTEDTQRRESILALIEEYKKYTSSRTPEGRDVVEATARIVGATASKYKDSVLNPEDVVQQIAGDFYAKPRMRQALERFNPVDGPLKMRNFWASVLNKHAEFSFRVEFKNIIQKQEMKI